VIQCFFLTASADSFDSCSPTPGECLQWVNSRHQGVDEGMSAPLYPQERTCSASKSMSAKCQKRTLVGHVRAGIGDGNAEVGRDAALGGLDIFRLAEAIEDDTGARLGKRSCDTEEMAVPPC